MTIEKEASTPFFGFTAPFSLITWISLLGSVTCACIFAVFIARTDKEIEVSTLEDNQENKQLSMDGIVSTIWWTSAVLTLNPVLLPLHTGISRRILTSCLCWFALAVIALYSAMYACLATLQATRSYSTLELTLHNVAMSDNVPQTSTSDRVYLIHNSTASRVLTHERDREAILTNLGAFHMTYAADIASAMLSYKNNDVIVLESYAAVRYISRYSGGELCNNIVIKPLLGYNMNHVLRFDKRYWKKKDILKALDPFEQQLYDIEQR